MGYVARNRFQKATAPVVADDSLLSATQLAKKLAVQPSWVRRAMRMKKIPYLKVGLYVRFEWPAVKAALSQPENASQKTNHRVPVSDGLCASPLSPESPAGDSLSKTAG